MRHFTNNLEDFTPGAVVQINREKYKQIIDSFVAEHFLKISSATGDCDGGLYVGSPGIAYALYYLSQQDNLATSTKRNDYLQSATMYLKISLDYCEKGRSSDPPSSFILGKAGVCAVAAMIYKVIGYTKKSDEQAARYAATADNCKKIDFFRNGSDELFVGRAGYLCGILILRKELDKKVVDDVTVNGLCSVTVQSGRQYARRHRSKSPLMYAYYGTEYLGAAHGLCSILQMLLSFPEFLKSDPSAEQDIKQSVDFLLSLEQPNFNYPPAMDDVVDRNRRSENDELVHWCHGAPGIVYLFARAYKVWGDEKYLQASLRCGDIVWQKGLLRKGPGICHGVAGSGYVFLLLFRLTGDQKHLHRALKFAEFLFTPEFQHAARTPDSPYSLYEGWAGTLCFLADLLNPEKAQFPFFDVFI
ncbi:hypothetical protein ScPMuIL_011992 [Solemya velum]